MSVEHATGLRVVAATRSADAAERARRALVDLHKRSDTITFVSVAARAKVSRQFLYANAELRAEIERLRGEPRLLVRERASDESIRTRLRAALEENKRLREEIAQLRDELALTHGHLRELELAGRSATRVSDGRITTNTDGEAFIDDMSTTSKPRHQAEND